MKQLYNFISGTAALMAIISFVCGILALAVKSLAVISSSWLYILATAFIIPAICILITFIFDTNARKKKGS